MKKISMVERNVSHISVVIERADVFLAVISPFEIFGNVGLGRVVNCEKVCGEIITSAVKIAYREFGFRPVAVEINVHGDVRFNLFAGIIRVVFVFRLVTALEGKGYRCGVERIISVIGRVLAADFKIFGVDFMF